MFNNIKYISILFITLNKKAMKNLTIILIALSLSCSGQFKVPTPYNYSSDRVSLKSNPEFIPIGVFVINGLSMHEIYRNTNEFALLTDAQQARACSNILWVNLGVGAVGYVIVKYFNNKPNKHKKRRNYTFKFI